MTIPHGIVEIKVLKSGIPIKDIKVNLFDENATSSVLDIKTNSNGIAVFHIPADKTYFFRVKEKKHEYQTEPLNIYTGETHQLEMEIGK